MQDKQKGKEQGERFISREGWSSGPWDDEPDNVFLNERPLPLLLRRSLGGAWFASVGLDPKFRSPAAALRTAMETPERILALIDFPDKAPGTMDRNLVYFGYIYIGPEQLRPSEAHYLNDLPQAVRESYHPEYVTLKAAIQEARQLAVALDGLGFHA